MILQFSRRKRFKPALKYPRKAKRRDHPRTIPIEKIPAKTSRKRGFRALRQAPDFPRVTRSHVMSFHFRGANGPLLDGRRGDPHPVKTEHSRRANPLDLVAGRFVTFYPPILPIRNDPRTPAICRRRKTRNDSATRI